MAMIMLLTHSQDVLMTWALQTELILGGGHRVVVKHDPKQALVDIVDSRTELVLADYAGVDGGWLCREIKKTRALSHLPVILLSPPQSLTEVWMVEHLLRTQYGCNDCLPQSAPTAAVRELVEAHLAVRRVKSSVSAARSRSRLNPYPGSSKTEEPFALDSRTPAPLEFARLPFDCS